MKCYDTELGEGAKNDIGVRVMYMFNVARATQNEQRVEDHSWVSEFNNLISIVIIIIIEISSLFMHRHYQIPLRSNSHFVYLEILWIKAWKDHNSYEQFYRQMSFDCVVLSAKIPHLHIRKQSVSIQPIDTYINVSFLILIDVDLLLSWRQQRWWTLTDEWS